MINSISRGLRVEVVSPSLYQSNVDINSQIKIEFNSDLNTDTIIDNFIILKDAHLRFTEGENIIISNYETVEGLVTYENNTIIFTPSNQLDTKSRYIIYVKKQKIMDILGNILESGYVSYFNTGDWSIPKPCSIIEPLNNSILESLETILVEDVGIRSYYYQISKVKTFEVVVTQEAIVGTTITRDFAFGDGIYYIRAKAENGEYGSPNTFTIKTHRDTTPTEQDLSEDYIYVPYDDAKVEIIGEYPEAESVENNVKTNLFYKKFNKIIPIEEIDFYEATVYGEYTDQDDNYDSNYAKEHGEVDGTFSVVYDEEKGETYIFFIPTEI